jgi:hypothetical protein
MGTKPDDKPSFSVRANPVVRDSGELDHVRFTADGDRGAHKEWRVTPDELDQALHSLESGAIRYEVLNHIRSGARVDLPGTFSEQDILDLGFRDLC